MSNFFGCTFAALAGICFFSGIAIISGGKR